MIFFGELLRRRRRHSCCLSPTLVENLLLRSHIEIHRIGIHACGAHKHVSQSYEHQVGISYSDHELTRGNKRRLLRRAVPEYDSVRAEIVPVDGDSEGHAVCGYTAWYQRSNRRRRHRET